MPGAGHALGWWPLDATSGTVAADSSGTGNNAFTSTSGVTWSGGAATLDGSSGLIRTSGPVLTTTASYTVSAWVNLSSTAATQTVVSQGGGTGAAFSLRFDATSGKWAFVQTNNDATTSTVLGSTATTGTWTHLVAGYDNNTATASLYVNGALAGSTADTRPSGAPGPLAIGAVAPATGTPSQWLNGAVDNVQVYLDVSRSWMY